MAYKNWEFRSSWLTSSLYASISPFLRKPARIFFRLWVGACALPYTRSDTEFVGCISPTWSGELNSVSDVNGEMLVFRSLQIFTAGRKWKMAKINKKLSIEHIVQPRKLIFGWKTCIGVPERVLEEKKSPFWRFPPKKLYFLGHFWVYKAKKMAKTPPFWRSKKMY